MIDPILDKIRQQIDQGVYPGVSLALYCEGSWQEHYLGTVDGQTPVQPGLTYDLASVSKVIGVGSLILNLLNEKKIVLDQPLAAYYPAIENKSVTLRQLLTHTSGLDPYIPNRDSLSAQQLRQALHSLGYREDRSFHYTDVNFLLLGFFLEAYYGRDLASLCQEKVFDPFGMTETSFGPVAQAVPTVAGQPAGLVHDPKARVLGTSAGSAGLFSTIRDLEIFLDHYLTEDFAMALGEDHGGDARRQRSLAWDKKGDWLLHTGYTGTFIMYNRQSAKAAIFLSNRTYDQDVRDQWKKDRNQVIQLIMTHL